MKIVAADLHLHTALSPCADDGLTPPELVRAARAAGLDLIAVTDHNSARNAAAVERAAGGWPVVIAGMEITTAEEVHLLGLFPSVAAAEAAGERVGAALPPVSPATERFYGVQCVCDAEGRRCGEEPRLLAAASDLDLAAAAALVRRHGGLLVAAHVDRPSFSVCSQLGVFPSDLRVDAVEISPADADTPWRAAVAALGFPVLRSSDAHYAEEVGKVRSRLAVEGAGFAELALALAGRAGRGVL